MIPEERAARLSFLLSGVNTSTPEGQRILAREIRAAENAALERAARECPIEDWEYGSETAQNVYCALLNTQEAIRYLKTRAPRARKAKR